MKNLRNLLNQDSDSFNNNLKIAVCSVLAFKVFLLIAVLWNL